MVLQYPVNIKPCRPFGSHRSSGMIMRAETPWRRLRHAQLWADQVQLKHVIIAYLHIDIYIYEYIYIYIYTYIHILPENRIPWTPPTHRHGLSTGRMGYPTPVTLVDNPCPLAMATSARRSALG